MPFLHRSPRVFALGIVVPTFVLAGAACGSRAPSSGFDGQAERDGGTSTDGGTFATGDAGTPAKQCANLQCNVATCSSGGSTTVSGTVYDPAGNVPLYNAIVYVPNAKVAPFTEGVTCDRCGVAVSGSPITTALSGADGKFVLKDVPVGANVPLVIQIGKWRRQVTIPNVAKCADTALPKELTRLARNHSEGDIPKIAMVTGTCDHMECLLRNIGIDDAEFTTPTGGGRVHMYQGSPSTGIPPVALAGGSPPATNLWGSAAAMKAYDVVIDGCECEELPQEKPQVTVDSHVDYVNSGGRLFTADYQYYWIAPGFTNPGVTSPWTGTAQFQVASGSPNPDVALVDTSFPKGQAFADWLFNVGVSPQKGTLALQEAFYRAVAVNAPSTRWLYGSSKLFHYTFNAPVGASAEQQCGKVVFSDFHVVGGVTWNIFPQACTGLPNGGAEQRALEFMLFDLSACIQNDSDPPTPPPVVK